MKNKEEILHYNALNIILRDSVYEPSDDTFLLIDVIKKEIDCTEKPDVLEIGCGTGIISILLSKSGCNVVASDISDDAIELTKTNAKINNAKLKVVKSNLLESIKGRFDYIIFNPPYLPEDEYDFLMPKETKMSVVGGKKGNEVIIEFLKQAKEHLKPRGSIFIVISSLSNIEEIMSCASKNKLEGKILATKRFFFEEICVIEFKKQDNQEQT